MNNGILKYLYIKQFNCLENIQHILHVLVKWDRNGKFVEN